MDGYTELFKLEDPVLARNLVVALEAYGFHPRSPSDGGLPGMPGVTLPGGIPISLPDREVADGRLLADALLKEMKAP